MTDQEKDLFYKILPIINKIFRLKWFYIILNSWHPVEQKRRAFVGLDREKQIFQYQKQKI
jgi:hypothetical protein